MADDGDVVSRANATVQAKNLITMLFVTNLHVPFRLCSSRILSAFVSAAEILPQIKRLAASRVKADRQISSRPPAQYGKERPVAEAITQIAAFVLHVRNFSPCS